MATLIETAQPMATPPDEPGRRQRSFWHRVDVKVSPYLYIAPFFVIFATFGLFPLAYTGYVSLTGWRNDRPGSEGTFVGFANYLTLWHDQFFWNALRNTIGIGLLSTVPQLLLALGIFVQLFGRDYGLVNWLLSLVGVQHIDWQAGTLSSWIGISVIVTWRWTGYNALIYLAAMQAVPFELYESAAIDGASRWAQFRTITVPMLRPTILFTVIVSTIGALQLFGEPLLFNVSQTPTAGGSQHQFQTLAVYTYDQFWQKFKYGYGSAISWAMFVIIVIIVVVNLLLARRIKGVDAS
jgi:cellobiose transport system permease protein